MLENGLKINMLCSQWSALNGFNCLDQAAEPRGRSDPVYTDSAKKPDLAEGRLEKILFWHVKSVFFSPHVPLHTVNPVGNSDSVNCYLPIGLQGITESSPTGNIGRL